MTTFLLQKDNVPAAISRWGYLQSHRSVCKRIHRVPCMYPLCHAASKSLGSVRILHEHEAEGCRLSVVWQGRIDEINVCIQYSRQNGNTTNLFIACSRLSYSGGPLSWSREALVSLQSLRTASSKPWARMSGWRLTTSPQPQSAYQFHPNLGITLGQTVMMGYMSCICAKDTCLVPYHSNTDEPSQIREAMECRPATFVK
ncbi:hypothetical protein BDP55DRAFT_4172 [Colletotrichum godetiae]|uniref:Uncharacterized protein n=1 Tax=Colletotrichum godetiae TaxID=1209918 RepID=A0AAJ0F2T2_9PEZI|nr:uncharacterized protein BDP55DRAFT_4172 [Colletotrichum godetiae]KAK1700966.1 hypothetical protein BDP55DRAFT_4172 [Colletotrichum godetiae]